MIPICYSGNKAYFEGLLLSAMSVVKYTKEDVTFYVLTMELPEDHPKFLSFTDEQIALLNKVIQEKNPNNKAIKIDVTKEYKEHLIKGKNHKNGYTPYAALRLLLDLVPNIPDKMLYLDIDTMCCSDIKQLWDVDISDYDIAATRDYMGRFWIHPWYFNSGVLSMNMKNIKERNIFDKCRKKVFKTKMIMPDQSALNKYAKRKYIPFKFNEQRSVKKDTVVKHFCEGIDFYLPFWLHVYNIKQWQRDQVHKKFKIFIFDDLYEEIDKIKAENSNCF